MNIIFKKSLKKLNTFGVDVYSEYFVEVHSVDELKDAITFAKNKNLSILFLGGGSNILFTKNYEGIVILLRNKGILVENMKDDKVLISVQAGENFHQFILWCLEKGYGGLENLSLIPGNVGTTPIQNVGAYGVEIKDILYSCKTLNLETLLEEEFSNIKCNFGYRESFFKREGKGKYVITEVCFKLTLKNHKLNIGYGAIQKKLDTMKVNLPTIKDISNAVISIRTEKLPNPNVLGNSGSFFKNPIVMIDKFEELKEKYPEIPHYLDNKGVKIPAGWLIEKAGWKGKQLGNVAIHHLQALVVINATGNATGQEIFDFSSQVILSVKEKFGIELEREVNII